MKQFYLVNKMASDKVDLLDAWKIFTIRILEAVRAKNISAVCFVGCRYFKGI